MIAITDPAKTLERCYERLNEERALHAYYLSVGWKQCAKLSVRRMAGLKATITRATRMLEAL